MVMSGRAPVIVIGIVNDEDCPTGGVGTGGGVGEFGEIMMSAMLYVIEEVEEL